MNKEVSLNLNETSRSNSTKIQRKLIYDIIRFDLYAEHKCELARNIAKDILDIVDLKYSTSEEEFSNVLVDCIQQNIDKEEYKPDYEKEDLEKSIIDLVYNSYQDTIKKLGMTWTMEDQIRSIENSITIYVKSLELNKHKFYEEKLRTPLIDSLNKLTEIVCCDTAQFYHYVSGDVNKE